MVVNYQEQFQYASLCDSYYCRHMLSSIVKSTLVCEIWWIYLHAVSCSYYGPSELLKYIVNNRCGTIPSRSWLCIEPPLLCCQHRRIIRLCDCDERYLTVALYQYSVAKPSSTTPVQPMMRRDQNFITADSVSKPTPSISASRADRTTRQRS
jgi:hypothetical protein